MMAMRTFHVILFFGTAAAATIVQSKFDTLSKIEDTVDGLPIVGGIMAKTISMLK